MGTKRQRRNIRLTRDLVLFTAGLLGVLHETVIYRAGERPALLILFAGMLGLPLYLRQNGA